MKSILEKDAIVYTMNFSGHGGGMAAGDFSIPLFAGDVERFIATHALASVHVFGYSLGG
ncbi:MAG: hypothetical protein ABIX01_01160 [Chitinophagaceae bacterium]